jgi:hypothetical protein
VKSSAATDPGVHSSTIVGTTPLAHQRTQLQDGIQKTKVYTDGTIWYGCPSSAIAKPRSNGCHMVWLALYNCHLKIAMDSEYHALQKMKHDI